MSHPKLPKLKVITRNHQAFENPNINRDQLSYLINPSNSNSDIFHYSKLYFNNCFQTGTPSLKISTNSKLINNKQSIIHNKDYSSSILFPRRIKKCIIKKISYIVDEKKVPEIYPIHSKIIKQSILKSKLNSLRNRLNNYNENDYLNDSCKLPEISNLNSINMNQSLDMNIFNNKDNILFSNYYKFKKSIKSSQIKEIIDEELNKAKIKQVLSTRSLNYNHYHNGNRSERIMMNNNNKIRNNERNSIIKQKRVIKSPIKTKWIFITKEMMQEVNVSNVEISKYASPYSVIENEDLMKKMFTKNLSYLQFVKDKRLTQNNSSNNINN